MQEFKNVRYRIERIVENESEISGLSMQEIKQKLIEDWGYTKKSKKTTKGRF